MPSLFKPSRGWLFVYCLLFLCAGLTILTVWSELKRRGPFWEKYQKVERGMTVQEVEAVLGPPTEDDAGGFSSDRIITWKDGEQWIWVYFDYHTTKTNEWKYGAYKKSYYPEPIWERFIPETWWKNQWDRSPIRSPRP